MSEMSARVDQRIAPDLHETNIYISAAHLSETIKIYAAATRNSRSRGDTRQVAVATVTEIDRVTRAILGVVHLTG
jgi:hypothetical protein